MADYSDEDLQLMALAEAQAEQEAQQKNSQSQNQSSVGPDYNQSLYQNFLSGGAQAPVAGINMAKGAYNLATSPIQTIQNAGVEGTANTIGSLAAGTAGASVLGPLGAEAGTFLWPGVGTIIGGLAGGALGFGGGLLGFDVSRDAAKEVASGDSYIQPTGNYLKNLAYNTGQGLVLGGVAKTVGAIPKLGGIGEGFTQAGAEGRVASDLAKLDPNLSSKIDQALLEQSKNPFLDNLSTGELVNSDVLKNAQRTLARSDLSTYQNASDAYNARNDVQLKYLNNQIETSPQTIADVQNSIGDAIQGREAASQVGISSAEDAVRFALGDLKPPIDSAEAGGLIRAGAEDYKGKMDRLISESFNNIKGEGSVDLAPVRAVSDSLMSQYFKDVGAQPNSDLVSLVEDLNRSDIQSQVLGPDGNPVTTPATYNLKDTQAIRSKALEIAQGSDRRSASIAGQIAESLRQAEDAAIKSGSIPKEEAAALQIGRALRKKKGEILESSATPMKQVLAKQAYGEFKLPESALPSKFFRAGDRGVSEAIQNYKRALGDSPDALDPLYRYATDSFRQYVVKSDGLIDTAKANKWMSQHETALKELPDLKKQLQNPIEAQTFLNEKYGDLKRSQAEVESGALRNFLQADPEKAIPAILQGKDMVKRTVRVVQFLKANDPDAIAGLRRGVIDYLKQKTFIPDSNVTLEEASLPEGPAFNGTVKNALFKSEWERIKPALERSKLFTDSQMKGFDYLYKDKASQLSVEKAKMPGGSDTAQNQSVLASLTKMASSGFLKAIPYGNYIATVLEPILKTIPKERYMNTLEEALLNPRVARDLLNKSNAKNFTKSVETIFKSDIQKALGNTTPGNALLAGAKVAAPFAPEVLNTPRKQKLSPPNQQKVISSQSFPDPKAIMNPPAPQPLKKVSLNLDAITPETRARIQAESSGNPYAVSPKGAQGLSQIMPDTGQYIAKKLGETYTPITSDMTPEQQMASIMQNIRFGNFYYNEQLNKYKNPTLARVAYNAGPGRVDEAMKLAGTSTDINRILAALPKGVRDESIPYKDKIARLAKKYA